MNENKSKGSLKSALVTTGLIAAATGVAYVLSDKKRKKKVVEASDKLMKEGKDYAESILHKNKDEALV